MPTMCRNPGEGRGGLQAVLHGVVANNNSARTYSDSSQDHGAREGRYAIQSAKDWPAITIVELHEVMHIVFGQVSGNTTFCAAK